LRQEPEDVVEPGPQRDEVIGLVHQAVDQGHALALGQLYANHVPPPPEPNRPKSHFNGGKSGQTARGGGLFERLPPGILREKQGVTANSLGVRALKERWVGGPLPTLQWCPRWGEQGHKTFWKTTFAKKLDRPKKIVPEMITK